MGITISEVLRWQPSSLRTLSAYLSAQARIMDEVGSTVQTIFSGISTTEVAGAIRDNGEARLSARGTALIRDSISLQRLSDALMASSNNFEQAQSQLRDAIQAAVDSGFTVDISTGTVTSASSAPTFRPLQQAATVQSGIQAQLAEVMATDREESAIMHSLMPALHRDTDGGGRGASMDFSKPAPPTSGTSAASDLPLRGTQVDWAPGQNATIYGDETTAKTVITFVPGTGFDVHEPNSQEDRVRGLIAASGEKPEDVAVIVWAYDAPPALTHAASAQYYTDETAKLQSFQSSLTERTVGKQVVVGYSYGSTLVAQATRGTGLYADQVMLVGSPGAGPGIESTKDMTLRKRDGSVYDRETNEKRVAAATSKYDPIQAAALTGIHGDAPTSKKFDATTFDLWQPRIAPRYDNWFSKSSRLAQEDLFAQRILAVGNAHTEHYFGDDVFTQQTRKWLSSQPAPR